MDSMSEKKLKEMASNAPLVTKNAVEFFNLSELYKLPKQEIIEMLECFIMMAFKRTGIHSSLKHELSIFLSTLEGTAGVYPEIISDKEGDEDKSEDEILFEYIADALGVPENHYWRKTM